MNMKNDYIEDYVADDDFKPMKIFLITPVRNVTGEFTKYINMLIDSLEAEGNSIYWPLRDTNQDDDVGLRICEDNLAAMEEADMAFFVWDGKSQGSLFDLGMAFALNKRLFHIGMIPQTEGKSFQNMARDWGLGLRRNDERN